MSWYLQLCSYFLVGKAQLATIHFYWAIAEVLLMENKLNKVLCYKSALTEFLPMSTDGIYPQPDTYAHAGSCDPLQWLGCSSKNKYINKNSLYFAQRPKTITPPKAAQPRHQLESNSASVLCVKCLWTLMSQHFKRAAHVWQRRTFGQEEKACWSGNVFMKTCVVLPRIVWSEFEHPRDVITPTVPPQTQSAAMRNRCLKKKTPWMFYTNMGSDGQDPGPNYPNTQMLHPVRTKAKLFRVIFTISGIYLLV